MKTKLVLIALAMTLLASCASFRVEDYYHGYNFISAGLTPGADAELSVLRAPIPCGTSFCPSDAWQSIGTVTVGATGGTWPNPKGVFQKVIQRDEMASRRGVAVTCNPGAGWDLCHTARDPVTGKVMMN